MNSFLKYLIPTVFAFFFIVTPLLTVYATTTPGGGSVTPQGGSVTPQGGSVTPGGGSVTRGNTQILNPLGSSDITQFFLKIMQILILFAVPIIVFFIILSGFKYVMARGNAAQIETATRSLTWAVIGGVLILGAEIILQVIQGTVAALR
ncbi:pilin [Patescibacteria group bacterium]|nr:pilin [Patescibacteria group bacterium]